MKQATRAAGLRTFCRRSYWCAGVQIRFNKCMDQGFGSINGMEIPCLPDIIKASEGFAACFAEAFVYSNFKVKPNTDIPSLEDDIK